MDIIKSAVLISAVIFLFSCSKKNSNSNESLSNTRMSDTSVPVNKADFESTRDGKTTDLYVLKNDKGMKVAITNYGGRIVSWMAPDKEGNSGDIILGFDHLKGYYNANATYYGALIGRYGNRIADGKFSLNGSDYSLAINNAPNSLHGGPRGFHNVVWDAKRLDNQHLHLKYLSKDGEEGFPGNLTVQVLYILNDQNELTIDYTAVTDKATPVNLTNHAYFNLGGAASGTINNQELMINAQDYTPVDSTLIPTGEIAAVKGTPFDFTEPTAIGERVKDDNPQLKYGKGYDHNFVLDKEDPGTLTLAARVHDPESGRLMEIFTTEPGIQFYGGNFMDGSGTGKEGKPYKFRTAFALEPQHFPDSPNEPEFPSTTLEPDSVYHTMSIYRLSVQE